MKQNFMVTVAAVLGGIEICNHLFWTMKIWWMIYLTYFLKLVKQLQRLELLMDLKFYFLLITIRTIPPRIQGTIDDYDDDDDGEGESICIDDQKTFIWSNSALYLLGPKTLFWVTLFAVHVHESSITINLPCLCSDVYEDLLSRLTYLVGVIFIRNY